MPKFVILLLASIFLSKTVSAIDMESQLLKEINIINLQYTAMLEQGNMRQWLTTNQDLIHAMQPVADAHAIYSNNLLDQANAIYMLDRYVSRFHGGIKVLKNPAKIRINANNPILIEHMVSCRALQPLMQKLTANPDQISGVQFTRIQYLWKSCYTVYATDSLRYRQRLGQDQTLSAPALLYFDTYNAEIIAAMEREYEFTQSLQSYVHELLNRVAMSNNSRYPAVDIYAARYIQELSAQEYARVTGSTLADGPELYAKKQAEKQSRLKATMAQASNQPLPQAPFSFNVNEEHAIRANMTKMNWKCNNTLTPESTGGDFVSKLYICGITSIDPAFKAFTNSYFLAYQKK